MKKMKRLLNFKSYLILSLLIIFVSGETIAQSMTKDYPSRCYFSRTTIEMGYRGKSEEKWNGVIFYKNGRVYVKNDKGKTMNSYLLTSKGIYKNLENGYYGYIFTSKAEMVTGIVLITEICKTKTTIGYQFILSNGWIQTFYF